MDNEADWAAFGRECFSACAYLDKAVPVQGRTNVERIRFAADEILRLRAEVAYLLKIDKINRESCEDCAAEESTEIQAMREEILATWHAARKANGQLAAFRILERMVDRLGYGRTENNPSLTQPL